MKVLLQIFFFFLTWFTSSATFSVPKFVVPTNTTIFQKTEQVTHSEKAIIGVENFARSSIEEQQETNTTFHQNTFPFSSYLKKGNSCVLDFQKAASPYQVIVAQFSTKEQLSLLENRARVRSDKFVSGAGNALRRIDDFIPSSGTQLIGSTNKTTTLLGRWIPDMQVVKGKMLPNEFNVGTEFGTEASNIGGFNFLNIPQIPLFFPFNISVRSTNLPAKPLYSQKQIQLL